jgi:hypothetical protein
MRDVCLLLLAKGYLYCVQITQTMITPEQAEAFFQLVTNNQQFLIVLPASPEVDEVATALGIVTAIEGEGKKAMIVGSDFQASQFVDVVGVEKIKEEVGHQNLHVAFAYSPEAVDKVSYHIDEQSNEFVLVIQPQKGHEPLEKDQVRLRYAGADADVVILVGVHSYEELGPLYETFEQLFKDAMTVSINTYETKFATMNFDTTGSTSLSEAIVPILEKISANDIDGDTASNLLLAVEVATDRLRSMAASAETFELVSRLMRYGARRRSHSPLFAPQPPAVDFSKVKAANGPLLSSGTSTNSKPANGDQNLFASKLKQAVVKNNKPVKKIAEPSPDELGGRHLR